MASDRPARVYPVCSFGRQRVSDVRSSFSSRPIFLPYLPRQRQTHSSVRERPRERAQDVGIPDVEFSWVMAAAWRAPRRSHRVPPLLGRRPVEERHLVRLQRPDASQTCRERQLLCYLFSPNTQHPTPCMKALCVDTHFFKISSLGQGWRVAGEATWPR